MAKRRMLLGISLAAGRQSVAQAAIASLTASLYAFIQSPEWITASSCFAKVLPEAERRTSLT